MIFDLYQLFFIFCLNSILFNRYSYLICLFLRKILNILFMSLIYTYRCQFSSLNRLTGELGHFDISVHGTNIKNVMKELRSLGFSLGKDFVYWKLPYFPPSCPTNLKYESLT